ncbi:MULTISPECIES: ribonuclease III [Chryseobacterium]|jgi:ribonuclease-3|uniref:Ribonuclease 3 n=1 Tax=Chryseobacterium indoltheticum TaxID=254 RepID=A0A381FMS1_9FLAO|nr:MULTISPECIES: ribonuclease III [Chryseobacterium]AZA62309.1 ribonuclease III [Chryseobacterium indoltheticum]AZA75645.1 ribonuclease III [Chryseobacterium indoltheticum]MDF2833380.1 rnc [Chryseobacterium indoltheticum]MDQ8143429.1 ribonuclease III [Chryseobacterium sp. CFS15]QQQ27590.1 ribonuclease III [Chryseobacterium indoltheticum]
MELQKYFSKFLIKKRKRQLTERDYFLSTELNKILGIEVQNVSFYREAFSIKTSSKNQESNYERLEFLGDSVLGTIVSCHLFQTYPKANEGYMTQMKSKIVNRKNLNKLGEDLKLTDLLQKNNHAVALGENISGNLFEALIGAVYLDFQYEICKKIVLDRLLTPTEINKLENKIVSYKGLLLEWSQKKKLNIKYETCEEIQVNKSVVFRCHVWLGSEKISNAAETSKKKAEEKAAQRAFYILNKKENILGNPKTL